MVARDRRGARAPVQDLRPRLELLDASGNGRGQVAVLARLAPLLLVIAVLAACAGPPTPSTAVLAETHAPTTTPRPTPDPCGAAITRLGSFTQLLAVEFTGLRSLIAATDFDTAKTVAASRHVSAILTEYSGLEDMLRRCEATAKLAAQVDAVRTTAQSAVDDATSVPISDVPAVRAVAVRLAGLLPRVVTLSKDGQTIADTLGNEAAVSPVPPGPGKPLRPIPPGAIAFGKGFDPDTLAITGGASSFKATEARIAFSASFTEAAGATGVTIIIARRSAAGVDTTLIKGESPVSDPTSDAFAEKLDLSLLVGRKPGTYVVRCVRGATVLAEGTFTLT